MSGNCVENGRCAIFLLWPSLRLLAIYMDLFRFFRSMYDVGCQFVKKDDNVDSKVTNQETSTVSVLMFLINLRFVYAHLRYAAIYTLFLIDTINMATWLYKPNCVKLSLLNFLTEC